MISRRISRVYKAGREAFKGAPSPAQDNLLRAMAAMIAEATEMKPPQKATKKKAEPKLPFSPGEFYDECLARVPHIIACEPYNKAWFGHLGKKMQATNGLTRDDMESFVAWVENGGLEFFTDCTFAHVIKHWDVWIVKARKGEQYKSTGKTMEEYL